MANDERFFDREPTTVDLQREKDRIESEERAVSSQKIVADPYGQKGRWAIVSKSTSTHVPLWKERTRTAAPVDDGGVILRAALAEIRLEQDTSVLDRDQAQRLELGVRKNPAGPDARTLAARWNERTGR